jgi:ADP-heptose:LPS heptosyltransferase
MLAKDLNMRTILTGTKEDYDLIESIIEHTSSKPVNASGKTSILELASLIKRCRLYITPDSAPMHIASAVGTPFIALFGPTDPVRHAAPSNISTIMRKELRCSPCYNPSCSKRNGCMSGITVEEVLREAKNIMSRDAVKA